MRLTAGRSDVQPCGWRRRGMPAASSVDGEFSVARCQRKVSSDYFASGRRSHWTMCERGATAPTLDSPLVTERERRGELTFRSGAKPCTCIPDVVANSLEEEELAVALLLLLLLELEQAGRRRRDCSDGRDAAATRHPADAKDCIGKNAPAGDRGGRRTWLALSRGSARRTAPRRQRDRRHDRIYPSRASALQKSGRADLGRAE